MREHSEYRRYTKRAYVCIVNNTVKAVHTLSSTRGSLVTIAALLGSRNPAYPAPYA